MSEFKIKVSVDLDTSDIESQLKSLNKEHKVDATVNMSKVKKQIQDIKKSFQNAFKFTSKDLGGLDKLIKTLAKINKETTPGGNKPSKKVSDLVNQYKDLSNTVTKLQKQLSKGGLGEDSIRRTNEQIKKLKDEMEDIYSNKMSKSQQDSLELFKTKNENKELVDLNNKLNKVETTASSLQTKLNSISFDHVDTGIISKLENELKEIKSIAGNIDFSFEAEDIGGLLSDLSRIQSEIKNLEKVENLASSFDKITSSANESGVEIKDLSEVINKLSSEASDLDGGFNRAFADAKNEANELKNEIKEIQSAMKSTEKSSKTFGDSIFGSFDDFKGNFSQFTLAEVAGDFITDGIRAAISGIKDTVVETDAAITDLNKVYDGLSGDKLKKYLVDVTEVAKGTGKTSVDVIQGTAKAVQSGIKDINDALEFSKQSAMFSNVGDVDQEQADTILTAVLSAYGGVEESLRPVREQIQGMSDDYSTLNKIMDLSNFAGNRYAVTTADVGEALKQSASTLQTNGVSLEESTAMIVAMNEVLQDASKSGNSLKSISAGLSGVAVSSKDGSIQLTKSGKALKEIAGIDVWNEKTGEIKDMYQVMDELYGKWDELSEAEQNALGTAIAGKTQLNSFNALLSNWETARKYVQDYKNGLTIGSAERENEKFLDSIAGKWNVIKENLKGVANTLITSDMAKGFLDGLIVITDGLNSFTKGVSNVFSSLAEGNIGKSISDSIYEAFEGLGLNNKFTTSLSSGVGNVFQGIFDGIKELAIDNTFFGQLENISKMLQSFSNLFPDDSIFGEIGDKLAKVDELVNYKFLGGKKRLDNSIEERTENINSIESEIQALENQKKSIDEVMETYDKLSSKNNRTAKENKQLTEITNQLAESNPDLVLGYDSDGNAILKNLKLQNKEYETQILLKRQAQRLEENELANDVLKRRTKEQEDYNKALEDYNDSPIASDTKRKEGLFGTESLQEYAARIKENNEKIAEENEKAYQQRLKDHQQYITDEQAIQEKYMNKMESSTNFGKMAEDSQKNILSFMDALDWTNFDVTKGNQFTEQLSNLGDKLVTNTKDMGNHSKAINQLTNDYAEGKANLTEYTKGLTEQYEAAGKFDTESFTAWRQGLQSYVDSTGDIEGANKSINEMAKSLNKITGIDTSTWKTALSFDPAPIDASNKALQKFLKSYGTGVQNLGKGGNADKLTAQFQSLQSSYEQMVSDLAEGKEIDVEYLVNATIGNPECIQDLVKEITADGKVTEEEMELLLNVQAAILNGKEVTDETIKKIAKEFNMTEEEVRIMLNVKTEVKNVEKAQEVESLWGNITDKAVTISTKILGEENAKKLQEIWLSFTNKTVELVTKILGEENVKKLKDSWENFKNKTVELVANIKNIDLSEKLKEIWEGLKNKTVELITKVLGKENVEKLKSAWENLKNKTVELIANIKNIDLSEKLKEIWEGFKDKAVELRAKILGEENVKTLQEKWENLKDKTVELATKVKDSVLSKTKELWEGIKSKTVELVTKLKNSETVKKIQELWEGIKSKTVELMTKVKDSALSTAKEAWESFRDKTVELVCSILNGNLVDDLKAKWEAIKNKVANLTANVSGTELVNTLKGYWEAIKTKVETLTANVIGTDAVNKLKGFWEAVKTKTETLTAKVSGSSAVQKLKDLWGSIVSKTVTITSKVKQIGSSIWNTVTGGKRSIDVPMTASYTPMLTNSSLASIPVSASASPLSDTPVTISDSPSSLASTPVIAKANSFGGTLDASKILSSLDFGISHIKNLEEALERLGNQLDFLDEKAETTFGQEKVNLLQQQIPLLREQQKIQEQIAKNERAQNNELIHWLQNKGFTFDKLGNITNYNNKLLQMEQNVESLKKKYDSLNDSSGNKKNESAAKSAQKAYESANDTLSKTKKYLEEYFNTNNKEITEASKKWWEYENSIRDAEKAIRDLANAQLQNKIDLIGEEIDFLDSKIENLNDGQKVQYLDQQNKLYREQQGLMHDLAEQMRGQLATLDENSDEYIELQKEIIGLSTEWWELESAIKSTNEELEEIRRNKAIEPLENSLQEMEYLLDRHSDRLDLIDAQYEKATDEKRIEGLIKKEQILNEQLATQEEARKRIYNLVAGLQNDLWKYGFKLDENSLISNYDEVLNGLVGTDKYEQAKEYADEYMEIVRGDLIDIQIEASETQNTIKDLAQEIQDALEEARQSRLEPFKNSLEEVRYELDRVGDKLDLLDETNVRSQGNTKISYLYDQMNLLNEKVEVSQKEFNALYDLIAKTQNDLWQYGFKLDENSLISNYDEVLNNLVDTDKYENAKKVADEYMELMRDDYIENKLEILETQNAIKDLQDEIEKAQREMALFSSTNKLKELNNEFDKLSTQLDDIGSKSEYAFGVDKLNLMKREIEVLNKQLDLQSEKLATMNEQANVYASSLSKYGFEFDIDGDISNFEETMELFKSDEQIENIKELCDEYMDLQREIRDLSSEYIDLENSIKDVLKEQLETTQSVEGEITKIIEKEVEKRRKEIEEYTDERIKLLEKEKLFSVC